MQEIVSRTSALAKYPSLTAPQAAELEALGEEFDRLDGERLALEHAEDRTALSVSRALAGGGGEFRMEGGSPRDAVPAVGRRARLDGVVGEGRGRALDVLDQLERSAEHMDRRMLDAVAGLISGDDGDAAARYVRTAGDPAYSSAFRKIARNPQLGSHEWTDAERQAFGAVQSLQRAMAIGADATGHVMVPLELDPAVIMVGDSTSNRGLRSVLNVKQIVTDRWTGVTSEGTTAHWRPEAGEVDDDSPVLADVSVVAHRGDSFIPYSWEIAADAVNFVGEMSKLLADAAERLQAQAFVNGTGVGQPRGLVTAAVAAGKTVNTAGADTFALGDLYRTKAALPVRFRPNARWLLSEDLLDVIRQAQGGDGDVLDGATLAGRPFTETSEIDGTVTAGQANRIAVYGDVKAAYVVADRLGSVVSIVPHLFGPAGRRPTGQSGMILFFRTGGDLVIPDAVRVLTA
ncbi:phage major capsid protein [Geodermatophilus amargosae]|nr:phage major capsid protein [Geodermatophilus amargosae]